MKEIRSIGWAAGVLWALLLVVGPIAPISLGQDLPPEVAHYADLVFYNGHVLTMDRDKAPFTVTQALAVRDGRILAAGPDDRILKMAGPRTTRFNLNGRALMPGVIDTHAHLNEYAIAKNRREYQTALVRGLRPQGVRYVTASWQTKETLLADFKRAAQAASLGEWIYSIYFPSVDVAPMLSRQLTRYDLDSVVPDNPVWIRTGVGSSGIANTKMLEIITEMYGEKVPGFSRDDKGVLTGSLTGGIGETVNEEVIPKVPPELLAPIYKKELDEWAAFGVTTFSTRLNGSDVTTYAHMDQQGELPLRLAYSHQIGRFNPFLERYLRRFGGIQGHGTDRMWMIGISIGNPDGDPPGAAHGSGGGNCTTLPKIKMIERDIFPQGHCSWDDPGDPSREAPVIVNRYGYRIAGVHNFGDKAVQQSLEAYEAANREKSVVGKRFAIDHGPMVSQENIKQAAKLGAIWSLQPPLFFNRVPTIGEVWGDEVAQRWAMPTKSLIDAGVKFAYGADGRQDPYRHPMFGLQVLVTRKATDGKVYGAREKIDRATALLMMTRWGAEYVIREKEIGSLEPGKLADLVVLDKNPLDASVPDDSLSQIKVVLTIMGGKVAYGSLDQKQ